MAGADPVYRVSGSRVSMHQGHTEELEASQGWCFLPFQTQELSIPYLCGLPAQGGAEGQPLSSWAGTFFSADEVRQGWPLADLSPPCIPVLSQAQLAGAVS